MNRHFLEILKFLAGTIFIGLVFYESFVVGSDDFFSPYLLNTMFILYAFVFYLSKISNK